MANIQLDTRFGDVSIDTSKVITFHRGIPGYEKNTQWALFHELDENGNLVSGVVVHLLAIDDGILALPLTDPSLFGFSYEFELSDSETAELKLEDPNDILVLAVMSNNNVSNSPAALPTANIYANLAAPILINTKSRIGMQKLLTGRRTSVNYNPKFALLQ